MQLSEFKKVRNIEHLELTEGSLNGIRCALFPIYMWAYSNYPVGWYYRGLDGVYHNKRFIGDYSGYYYSYQPSFIPEIYGKKVCITEGIIDAEILRSLGFFSCAIMTAVVVEALLRDLKLLNQSVLFLPDNDAAGKFNFERNKFKFIRNNISFDYIHFPFKDIGAVPKKDLPHIANQIRSLL